MAWKNLGEDLLDLFDESCSPVSERVDGLMDIPGMWVTRKAGGVGGRLAATWKWETWYLKCKAVREASPEANETWLKRGREYSARYRSTASAKEKSRMYRQSPAGKESLRRYKAKKASEKRLLKGLVQNVTSTVSPGERESGSGVGST